LACKMAMETVCARFSNKKYVADAHGWFNRIRQVAPMFTPV